MMNRKGMMAWSTSLINDYYLLALRCDALRCDALRCVALRCDAMLVLPKFEFWGSY